MTNPIKYPIIIDDPLLPGHAPTFEDRQKLSKFLDRFHPDRGKDENAIIIQSRLHKDDSLI